MSCLRYRFDAKLANFKFCRFSEFLHTQNYQMLHKIKVQVIPAFACGLRLTLECGL